MGEDLFLYYYLKIKMVENLEEKLVKKFGRITTRVGGKGTIRRKKKTIRKSNNTEDKKLQTQLKKLNVNNIHAIEEVNLFQDNGKVIHFTNPRVQASIAANTYVVSGKAEEKNLNDLLPHILPQLGPGALNGLQNLTSNAKEVKEEIDEEIPLVEVTDFQTVADENELNQKEKNINYNEKKESVKENLGSIVNVS